MRKDSGFDVTDRIRVYISGSEKINATVLKNKEKISDDVLAEEFVFDKSFENEKEWSINGEKVFMGVERL